MNHDERYPTLTEDGAQMLRFLTEHPNAPIYRNSSGNRLTAKDLEQVRAFEAEVQNSQAPTEIPSWLSGFVEKCFAEVPFYRSYGDIPSRFEDIPTFDRAELSRNIARFVPDSAPVDRLMHFQTSGTTGHPLIVPSHPVVAAHYLAFHRKALRHFGIELRHGRGKVGVVLVGFQRKCFTYVSVTPSMQESGLAKINLHLNDWHHPDDRAKYLDDLAPEVYTGDPISLTELATLAIQNNPRAILSTSMTLSTALQKKLEARFQCPVLDLYSLNEAGPVAVRDHDGNSHLLLQHCMFVEILDAHGKRVAPGQRGEITLTGGFNFCLPLLRYRTSDYATLNGTSLFGLAGRPPVQFRTQTGEWINNVDVTHALLRFVIPQFSLHQSKTGSLHLRFVPRYASSDELRNALLELFGPLQELSIEELQTFEAKVLQYTSDLPGSEP